MSPAGNNKTTKGVDHHNPDESREKQLKHNERLRG